MGVTRKLVTKPEKHAARSKDSAAGKTTCSLRNTRAEALAENATLLIMAKYVVEKCQGRKGKEGGGA